MTPNIELVLTSKGEPEHLQKKIYEIELKPHVTLILKNSFPRWKEVSGADPICASCESGGFEVHANAVVSHGTSTLSGGGHGTGKPSDPSRKTREAAKTEGILLTFL